MMSDLIELGMNASSQGPTISLGMNAKRERGSSKSDSEIVKIGMNAKRPRKTEERRLLLMEEYKISVVNDFGDEYHMSEEEKKERNQYYEAFSKIIRSKRKYRKLSDYVKVFRLCLDCLDVVANGNGLYPPDKFKLMVAKGEITVHGLHFPKYIGKDRKDINWEYISKFISDRDADVKLLDRKQEDDIEIDFSDEDSIEENRRRFFGDDYDAIFCSDESDDDTLYDPTLDIEQIFNDQYSVNRGIDIDTSVRELGNKHMKHVIEAFPDVQKFVREVRRRRNETEKLSSFVFDISESDFEYIERLDKARGYTGGSMPEFKGDIMKNKDYMRYMYELTEWEKENTKVNYRGRNKTLSEIQDIELKEMLNDYGWNIRNLYKYKDKEKKDAKRIKEDRRNEKRLKKKLIDIQNRRKARENSGMVNAKKKKKKKNKKKKGND